MQLGCVDDTGPISDAKVAREVERLLHSCCQRRGCRTALPVIMSSAIGHSYRVCLHHVYSIQVSFRKAKIFK